MLRVSHDVLLSQLFERWVEEAGRMGLSWNTALVLISFSVTFISSIPIRGNHPWTIVLCKFRDFPQEPKPRSYFVDWITNLRVEDSIANYFRRVSNGLYSIDGSEVTNWLTLPYTKAGVEFLASHDTKLMTKFSDPDHRVII